MIFKDISQDIQSTYTLNAGEQCVFFIHNRGGDITFELKGPGAAAHVFAFCTGKNTDQVTLNIIQKHLAPQTTSRVLVKSVLQDQAQFSYRGTLHIAKNASLSDASQENRNLLLSSEAKAFSEPALEILNHDVRCHHAATTSPLNTSLLFFAQARGLSREQATTLLITGFFQSSLDNIEELVPSQSQEKMLALILAKLS